MEVTEKQKHMHKSFIGDYIPIYHPMFSVKLLLLLSTSFLFLGNNNTLRLAVLVLCIVLNAILLKRKALALGKFLLASTGVLVIIWCLLVRPEGSSFGLQSCLATLRSQQLHHALTRLWGLYAIGQLFAGCTSQYEILVFLRRIRANYTVSVFVILIGNAFAYFIQLYQQISEGFRMRCTISNPISRVFYILTSLMLNALSLVSGCKKVDMLYRNRIRNSILRAEIQAEPIETARTLECHFENVIYPDQTEPVIKDAHLSAKMGDIILLSGPNGCGKTTFLNLVSGIIPNILSASCDGCVENARQLENGIGMVFQSVENELFFDTAESQLRHLPPELRDTWLSKFHLDYEAIQNRSVMDFSSGEQQRLALVAELLDDSHWVCLLDEPTAFLDADGIEVFRDLLHSVSAHKIILVVSHDPACKSLANRWVMIEDGTLTEGYWTNNVRIDPFEPVTNKKSYHISLPESKALTEMTLTGGELVGILGANGSGKTTLGKQIFRALENHPDKPICTMMMQRSDHQLYESTVLREILLGTAEDDAAKARAMAYLKELDLDSLIDQPAQFLSGGQKRSLVILCMLMQNPDVLILDEPFSSLDAHHAQCVANLIRTYYQEHKPTIVICDQTHAAFPEICNRCIHL